MKLALPELSLVVLIGPSGSGKSTFARKHFKPTEILTSDYYRALVSDDENDQSATQDAFEVLHLIASKRLAAGKLTVIDATNVRPEDRAPLVKLARDFHCLPTAIVFNLHEKICHERNATRADRNFGPHVIRNQRLALRRGLRGLKREGFRHTFYFETCEEVDAAAVERVPLWNNQKHERGPFDIIGDVHGCFDELVELLENLGYAAQAGGEWSHPAGRRLVFLGDLVDRGPRVPDVLRLVMACAQSGVAFCVPGNHDVKFMRWRFGKNVRIAHGLAESIAQCEAVDAIEPGFTKAAAEFIDSLVSHYVLDDGHLVVAHAGMKADMQGRGSGKVREFALYGETTGETDEFGLPVRHNWAAEYRGRARVVYGHTPVVEAEWLNNTINIDTGCVFGGKLTALRYPEMQLVSVPSRRQYAEPAKPLGGPTPASTTVTAQQLHDDLLDISDVLGKRIIDTRLRGKIIISAEQSAAALEVLSRFAIDPKWLIYLPPTMSPCEAAPDGPWLEYPREAFAYFRDQGVPRVICEEKHMGSRAVAIVCGPDAAHRRFGVTAGESGVIFTRTGRRFFEDAQHELGLLDHLRSAIAAANLWDELQTDWLCLDCELMPWSAKAQALLREQYAAVGAAANAALTEVTAVIGAGLSDAPDLAALAEKFAARQRMAADFVAAYRRYCWPVHSVTDLKLAPFHILASENRVHTDRDHTWHMDTIHRFCEADRALHGDQHVLRATPCRIVDLADPASETAATQWWESLTAAGSEGMVIKPLDFIARGPYGLVQPAVKCRGREYLRIIYGPEYDTPDNLNRLRRRRVGGKRRAAATEFALGLEALERFVANEPLRRVNECAAAVLALESEPVDPRL